MGLPDGFKNSFFVFFFLIAYFLCFSCCYSPSSKPSFDFLAAWLVKTVSFVLGDSLP
jgi:hypothetical protein